MMNSWWEKFKEVGFTLNATGMFCGSFAVFLIIHIKGAAYVYEDIQWILWIEIIWAGSSALWGIERLIKDWQKKVTI